MFGWKMMQICCNLVRCADHWKAAISVSRRFRHCRQGWLKIRRFREKGWKGMKRKTMENLHGSWLPWPSAFEAWESQQGKEPFGSWCSWLVSLISRSVLEIEIWILSYSYLDLINVNEYDQVIIRYPSFESLWVHSYEVLQQHLQHQASRILSCRGGRLLKDAWRNCSSPEAWIAWMAWAVKKFRYQGTSMGICYVHRCAIVSQDVLRCIKMNAMKKLNCTLKSVTKVCAQVVLFLAVLAWCSSVLKRRKIDSSIQIQTYPTYQAQRLPETGLWISLDHPNSVSTQVRIIYAVSSTTFMMNWKMRLARLKLAP